MEDPRGSSGTSAVPVRRLSTVSAGTQSLAVKPQLTLQWGFQTNLSENGAPLAKPNYQYQKRQKELEKKKKQEEKRKRKLDSKAESEPDANAETPAAGEETPPA
jgi:hypothetical protein